MSLQNTVKRAIKQLENNQKENNKGDNVSNLKTLDPVRTPTIRDGVPSYILGILESHNIPWKVWGTGTSRTIEDFCKSLREERVTFRNWKQGPLIIDVHSAVIIVRYNDHGQWLELFEECQVFKLARLVLRRNFNGIAETIRNDENASEAAIRCLAEELDFTEWAEYQLNPNAQHPFEIWEPMLSEKWPRIWAAYHRHMFECQISGGLFKPEGYIQPLVERDIHFKWKPVSA